MTYDAWKTRSPDDDLFDYDDDPGYDYDARDCWHEDSEIDILTGRAECWHCGHSWWATDSEIKAQIEHMQRYDEWEAEQYSPRNRFKEWLSGTWPLVAWRRWQRGGRLQTVVPDDDIPF